MAFQHSEEIGHLLKSYAGPDARRVRTAIVKLAKGDVEKAKHYVARAKDDHQTVLLWADFQEQEDRKNSLRT